MHFSGTEDVNSIYIKLYPIGQGKAKVVGLSSREVFEKRLEG